MPRIIISGGGTGGHIFPAIAIADAIKHENPNADILFVGAMGKMEMERVPKAGYRIVGLKIAGFQRRFSIKNFSFPFKLMGSLIKAFFVVKKFKPDVSIGVGGYASGPVIKICNSLSIPTVIQEQNSYAGVTNRLLANKAELICVAYDGMEKFFPKDKIKFTGNPIRKDLLDNYLSKEVAKEQLGFSKYSTNVLIFGGSLGARSINQAVAKYANLFNQNKSLSILWQSGATHFESYKAQFNEFDNIRLVPFIENMDIAYTAADIVVCRAGALTISELAVLGKAAILVPSPYVAEDHQTVNAMSLVQKGAAILLSEDKVVDGLFDEISNLLADTSKIQSLETKIKYFARANAAKVIAQDVLHLIDRNKSGS